jgi:hypothetical protein
MTDIEALRGLLAEHQPPGSVEQLAVEKAFDRIEAQLEQRSDMRADLALLCGVLRELRYTTTVQEMQRFTRLRREVEARWGIEAARP